MRRADERAAAALHAEVDLEVHEPFDVALLVCRLHLARHQAQRTVRDALAALDAGRGLWRRCLSFPECQNRVRVLENRLLEVGHGDAHHRPAIKNHLRFFLKSAGCLKYILHPHTDRNEHIHGIFDRRAVDRHALFDKRQAGSAISCDGRDRRTVENDRAHVKRQLPFRNLLARHMVDEDFLAALRVHRLKRHDLHVLLMAYQFAIALDALGLVVLNAEDDARYLQKLLQKPTARNHVE